MKLLIKQGLTFSALLISILLTLSFIGCNRSQKEGPSDPVSPQDTGQVIQFSEVDRATARTAIHTYRGPTQQNAGFSFVDVTRDEFQALQQMFNDTTSKYDKVRIYFGIDTFRLDASPTKSFFTGFVVEVETGAKGDNNSFIVVNRIMQGSAPCPKTCDFNKSIFR